MYLRASMTSVDPGRIDELINHVRERVLPGIREQRGCRGLAMNVDREGGRGSVVTFWDDLDALRASDSAAGGLRDEAAERFGLNFEVTVAEILERHVQEQPRPGCWNRVTMIDVDPTDVLREG